MAEVCVLCNVLSCVPGFYSSGCAPGSVRDAVCLPCLNGPSSGPFNWTSGCEFRCSSGFWLNGTDCVACSVVSCAPGSYPSECGGTNNSECISCQDPPVSGPTNWTTGCEYVCADGYFFRSNSECVICSEHYCFPGYSKAACTMYNDSECVSCTEPRGGFGWISGCDYVCLSGYYRSIGGCNACSNLDCLPGTYLSECNASADAACVRCPDPGAGAVWTSGCDYACAASQYWFNGSGCQRCTLNRVCNDGWRVSACSQTSDSTCIECDQTLAMGSFEWTLGCEFRCNSGFFYQNGKCLRCSSPPACNAGSYLVNCTNVSDAVCAKCPSLSGNVVWTRGCEFECGDGYFMRDGACVACTKFILCAPGFKQSACSSVRDVVCEPCEAPQNGSIVWTQGCEYACAKGYFFDGNQCKRCRTDPCAAGTFAVDCTANVDLTCVGCAPPSGSFLWTSGCSFECADGYFKDGVATCSLCSSGLSCRPGTYLKPCSRSSDAECASCTNAPAAGYAWTAGCDFQCLAGYYRDPLSSCTRCSVRSCAPGTFQVPCTATSDARCAQCMMTMTSERFVWTDSVCGFKCVSGYYLANASFCEICYDPVCSPGFYKVACSTSADSFCAQCAGGGTGVVWGSDCQFSCASGYVLKSGQCELQPVPVTTPAPQVFAVVNTEMAMQNTVSEICSDVRSLMLAMSQALSALSNGTVKYQTNITMLDGEQCVENLCPQCSNSSSRRLLVSEIAINVVSQSTVPVKATAVILPSVSSLKDTLVQSLSSSVLSVGNVAATVSTKAVYAEPLDASVGFLFFFPLVFLLLFVSCACCIVCAACVKRCFDLPQYADSKRDCGASAESFFSRHNSNVSLNSGRMEAIDFRRRSKSRDRAVSMGLI